MAAILRAVYGGIVLGLARQFGDISHTSPKFLQPN